MSFASGPPLASTAGGGGSVGGGGCLGRSLLSTGAGGMSAEPEAVAEAELRGAAEADAEAEGGATEAAPEGEAEGEAEPEAAGPAEELAGALAEGAEPLADADTVAALPELVAEPAGCAPPTLGWRKGSASTRPTAVTKPTLPKRTMVTPLAHPKLSEHTVVIRGRDSLIPGLHHLVETDFRRQGQATALGVGALNQHIVDSSWRLEGQTGMRIFFRMKRKARSDAHPLEAVGEVDAAALERVL